MRDTLTITDNRTGKQYEIPITKSTIRAVDLRQIKIDPDEFGMMSYDPAFLNTAACRSRITFVDGDNGVLLHRGYPIEQLAEHSTFVETAYLLLNGELPTQAQLDRWTQELKLHTMLHENVKKFMEGFRYDAHPMGILLSTVGALSTLYPDARLIFDDESRHTQVARLIAKIPSIAAYAYRHSTGLPYVDPDNGLSFIGNFLSMLNKGIERRYQPDPVLERALDVLFILHADHEQNCSTSAMRSIGSSQADPYASLAGAAAALSGPLHGGANEVVLRMLNEIRTVDNVPAFIRRVKKGEGRLWVSNSLSGRRWQLHQVPAVRCPPYVVEVRTGYRVSARHGERRVAVQGRVAPCRVVVGLEVGEFPLQIPRIPEEHLVQKFSPYRADQALYKGV